MIVKHTFKTTPTQQDTLLENYGSFELLLRAREEGSFKYFSEVKKHEGTVQALMFPVKVVLSKFYL